MPARSRAGAEARQEQSRMEAGAEQDRGRSRRGAGTESGAILSLPNANPQSDHYGISQYWLYLAYQ